MRLREVLHIPLPIVCTGSKWKGSSHVHLALKAEFFASLHAASLGLPGSSEDLAQPMALPHFTYTLTLNRECPFSSALAIGVAI